MPAMFTDSHLTHYGHQTKLTRREVFLTVANVIAGLRARMDICWEPLLLTVKIRSFDQWSRTLPMISVVIVTYPRSESVIRCIQSIAAAADEIVVVIDGEPAVVAGALEVLQKSIPTLRIIKQHVSCKGSARNAGC